MTAILILIVEDNFLIQDTLEEALTLAGYDVVLASGGDEALALLDERTSDFQALLTDVDLPPGHVTGWDIARRARQISPDLPIIYMTGASGDDWLSKGVPKSVLLAKPFDVAQVAAAVSQLLDANAARPE